MERIYIVGFMGAGKSTVGSRLARALGYEFIDLDQFMEQRYATTISSLFEKYGESGFRMREQRLLNEVSCFERVVVATGGGTPCFFDNMELMCSTGRVIYLQSALEPLLERLLRRPERRPLVNNKSPEELKKSLSELMQQREVFYKQAHVLCDIENKSVTTLVNELLLSLDKKNETK